MKAVSWQSPYSSEDISLYFSSGLQLIDVSYPSCGCYCCSVAKLCPAFCDPRWLQCTRLLCPSLSPRVCSDSCSLSWWCHPSISSSVDPFFSCPQSFPASGSFPMSRLFTSSGQRIGASALASVFPMKIRGLISFRIDWFDLLAVQGTLKSLLQHNSLKATVLWCSAFFMVQLSHLYRTTKNTIVLTIRTFEVKVISLFFNTLSRFVIAFLPRSKQLEMQGPQMTSQLNSTKSLEKS